MPLEKLAGGQLNPLFRRIEKAGLTHVLMHGLVRTPPPRLCCEDVWASPKSKPRHDATEDPDSTCGWMHVQTREQRHINLKPHG